MTKNREYDLEDRLIAFADSAIDVAESVPSTRAGVILSEQLIRSVTSSALNYGEAQGAESKRDFIHKMGIILKELRESSINLKILARRKLISGDWVLKENRELIAIFVASIQTAKRNIS
jgi:four helix bundle protein